MDVSGSHQLDVNHNIKKQELDRFGEPAGAEQPHQLGGTAVPVGATSTAPGGKSHPSQPVAVPKADPTKVPGYCGPCYGAEDKPGQCCNTCEQVRQAYRSKGWAMSSLSHIEQCIASGETSEHYQAELDRGDGCRLFGDLQVNKVAGNFHFAPGKSFQHSHLHIHDLAAIQGSNGQPRVLNVSHHINRLSFGKLFPGVVNPLDQVKKSIEQGMSLPHHTLSSPSLLHSDTDSAALMTRTKTNRSGYGHVLCESCTHHIRSFGR